MTTNEITQSILTFEDENITYVERDGIKLFPVPSVGSIYGYSRDNSLKAFQRNRKFLKGNYYSVKLSEYERAVSVPCLTGEGVLIYTARLGIGNIPEDRQIKVIRTVQFMAKSAMGVITGELVPRIDINTWKEERLENKENHKLTMDYVKRYEVPKCPIGESVRALYPREATQINKDVAGVHVKNMSDKLNSVGLRIKNDTHVADRALMKAGIPFESRHEMIQDMLNDTYPNRNCDNLMLTGKEQFRIESGIPVSQSEITDFNT